MTSPKRRVIKLGSGMTSKRVAATIAPKTRESVSGSNAVKKKLSPIEEALTNMSPVKEVMLVHCDEASLMYARDMFLDQACCGGSKSGLTMPLVERVTSFYAGPPRQIEVMKRRHDALTNPRAMMPVSFEGQTKYGEQDLLNDDGVNTMRPYIEIPRSCTVFEQRIMPDRIQRSMENLKEMRVLAAASDSLVIVFLVGYQGLVDGAWQRVADEVIEIRECEPGPGEEYAFSIDCHSLRSFSAYGAGKQMCSMRTGERRVQHKYEAFISSVARDRVMWKLHFWGGFGIIEIASAFNLTRTSIDRVFRKLGGPREGSFSDDWLSGVREMFELDKTAFTKREKPAR